MGAADWFLVVLPQSTSMRLPLGIFTRVQSPWPTFTKWISSCPPGAGARGSAGLVILLRLVSPGDRASKLSDLRLTQPLIPMSNVAATTSVPMDFMRGYFFPDPFFGRVTVSQ